MKERGRENKSWEAVFKRYVILEIWKSFGG